MSASRLLSGIVFLLVMSSLAVAYGFKDVIMEKFDITISVAEEKKAKERVEGPAPVVVEGAAVCKDVQGGRPVGISTRFSTEEPQVVCWTWLNGEVGSRVRHRWIFRRRTVEGPWIELTRSEFTAWTRFRPEGQISGKGRVEIVCETGHVLDVLHFDLEKPESDALSSR